MLLLPVLVFFDDLVDVVFIRMHTSSGDLQRLQRFHDSRVLFLEVHFLKRLDGETLPEVLLGLLIPACHKFVICLVEVLLMGCRY